MPLRRFFRSLRRTSGGGIKINAKLKRRITVFISLAFILFLLIYVTLKIQPIIISFAEAAVKNSVTIAINEAVAEKMSKGGMGYDSLVTINKDESGIVTAITSNIVGINRLQAELTESITKKIKDYKTSEISIPLGNMFGNPFLSGRGPLIKFQILSVNTTRASFFSSFTAAGINQTRHRIMLDTYVNVTVMIPGALSSVAVTSQIMIAETVIVGRVPQTYANFGNTNTDGEDLESKIQKYQLIR